MKYMDNEHKWIMVLNRKIMLPQLFNAAGHLALGMGSRCHEDVACHFHNYKDFDGRLVSVISHWPVVVLQAKNSNQLRTLRSAAIAAGLTCQAFADTMIGESAEDQMLKTKETDEGSIEYFAILLFGKHEQLHGLTKKFSLFTQPQSASGGQEITTLDPH